MAIQIPTTEELNTTILANFESRFGYPVRIFAKAFLRVLAKILAGLISILYRFGNFYFLQQFVQFASTKQVTVGGKSFVPLLEWGRLVGAEDPLEGERAVYTFSVPVVTPSGSLAINTAIKSSAGVTYLTTSAVALAGTSVLVDAKAVDDPDGGNGYGDIGNLDVGAEAKLVNSPANVQTTVTVSVEVTRGVDSESWETYRQRVIDLFRKQPQGGAYVDYEVWSETVVGIINAYIYRGTPGIVEVYAEATPESCGNADGIPTGAQLTAVEEAIEYDLSGIASRRPVSSYISVAGITRETYDVEIYGLTIEQDETAAKTKLEASLSTYLASREPYIPGLTVGYRRDRVTASAVAGVVQDIADAYNGFYTTVYLKSGGLTIVADILERGEKAKLGTVTYN